MKLRYALLVVLAVVLVGVNPANAFACPSNELFVLYMGVSHPCWTTPIHFPLELNYYGNEKVYNVWVHFTVVQGGEYVQDISPDWWVISDISYGAKLYCTLDVYLESGWFVETNPNALIEVKAEIDSLEGKGTFVTAVARRGECPILEEKTPTPHPTITPEPTSIAFSPCSRLDASVTTWGQIGGIPVWSWLQGENRPDQPLMASDLDAHNEVSTLVTRWLEPDQIAQMNVDVGLPAEFSSEEWQVRPVRVEVDGKETPFLRISETQIQFPVGPCQEYKVFYWLQSMVQP